jgi:hypothetical protein
VEAVLAELSELNLPQFYAWCLLELAFLADDPAAVRRRVEQAVALDDGEHLHLAADVAALRAAILDNGHGSAAVLRPQLLARLEAHPVLETSLGYLLLADTAPSADERDVLQRRADARLEQEIAGLGNDTRRSRSTYLARRLPASG